MKISLFTLGFLVCHFYCLAQSGEISKKKYYDGQFGSQDTAYGYTEAVLAGNILYLSGSIGKGTMAEQLQRIYTDLGNILKAYGASYHNVVKETVYTTDIEELKKNTDVRKSFYDNDFPAATWVQVTRLLSSRKDAQVEVELIAQLPQSSAKK